MNTETAEAPTVVATLAMSGISKSFGGVAALTDVSLEVLPGEVHALLGENGAGKSTLMNVATGTIRPDTGAMVFQGQPIEGLDPREAARLGIAFVHQHPAVMPDLTVFENLLVALPPSVFPDGTSREDTARALLARVNLRVHLSDRVETLSVAKKHLLEIAKALAVNPSLLVLDEPTAPLGKESVDLLFQLVRDAVATGTSVVYITHRLAEVRELADRVTVLRDGRLRGDRGRGRDLRRRTARPHRRSPARLDVPAEARCGRERGAELRPRGPHRRRLQQRLARGAPRRDHRHRRGRRQRAERTASRAGRTPALRGLGQRERHGDDREVAAEPRRLPACRPTHRGSHDAAVGARERGRLRAEAVPHRSAHEPQARAGHGRRHPRLAVGEGGVPRRATSRRCPAATSRR